MSINLRLSSSASGTRNVFDNVVNFSSFGGSPANSGSANKSAMDAFNTAHAGYSGSTLLRIDPGTYAFSGGIYIGNNGGGGRRLVISAYGATLNGPTGAASQGFAGSGPYNDNAHNAKFLTVSAGAQTIALVTSGQTSLFAAGKWVLLTNGDMQGYGYPQNPAVFEFKQIQSIGTGTITFTEPLINSYKDTWPVYNAGSAFQQDLGGPANIYVLRDPWDQEIEFQGATFGDIGDGFYGKCRVALWTDCTFTTYGPFPTMCMLYRSLRCTGAGTGGLEIDKCIHRAEFIDTMHRAVDFQSSCINELYVSNVVQTGSNLRWRGGAGKSNTFLNSSFGGFSFGEMNYGAMGPTYMENVAATSGDWYSSNTVPFSDFTEEGGGVISYAGGPGTASNGFNYWAIPGGNAVLLNSSNQWARSFQITDVYQSGGRTYVATNLPYPLPSTINGKSSPWKIAAHPCADLTMVNGSGNPLFTSQSALPAHSPFNGWTL